jgi:hypothetical protein
VASAPYSPAAWPRASTSCLKSLRLQDRGTRLQFRAGGERTQREKEVHTQDETKDYQSRHEHTIRRAPTRFEDLKDGFNEQG